MRIKRTEADTICTVMQRGQDSSRLDFYLDPHLPAARGSRFYYHLSLPTVLACLYSTTHICIVRLETDASGTHTTRAHIHRSSLWVTRQGTSNPLRNRCPSICRLAAGNRQLPSARQSIRTVPKATRGQNRMAKTKSPSKSRMERPIKSRMEVEVRRRTAGQ